MVGIRPRLCERVPLVVLRIRVRTRVARRGRLQRDGRDLQLGRRPPAEQARRARAVRAQARRRAHRHMALAVTLVLATPVPSPTSRAAAVLALVVVVLRVEVEVRHVRGRRERAEARRVRARREALRDPAQALCLPARAAIRTPTSTGAVLARRGPARARARARSAAPAPAAAVDVRAAKVMHVDDDGGVEADAERLGRLRAAAGPAHLVEGCGGHGDAVRAQVPARVRAHGERLVAQLQRALEGWIATHLHRRMK